MASTADGAAASPPKSKSPSPEVAAPVNPGTIIVADDNADVDSTYEACKKRDEPGAKKVARRVLIDAFFVHVVYSPFIVTRRRWPPVS